MAWQALRKSINGFINKVNVPNIQAIVVELFGVNLVRGRGLFARSIIKAQASSVTFTHVYAALVAIVNTKLPQLGELVLKRLVLLVRRRGGREPIFFLSSATSPPRPSRRPASSLPFPPPQFRKSYRRNNKDICLAAAKFIAHLVNQQVWPKRGRLPCLAPPPRRDSLSFFSRAAPPPPPPPLPRSRTRSLRSSC